MKFNFEWEPDEQDKDFQKIVVGLTLVTVLLVSAALILITYTYHLDNQTAWERAKVDVFRHEHGVTK